jgi:hypothetical protein
VAVPQQNFVGIVIDDSSSMQVVDHNGKARSTFITDELARPDSELLTQLGKRFQLRVFRFSSSAERLQNTGDLTFKGTATRLGDALDRARSELSGLPVAGLIVATDGSDNAERTIDSSIAGLKASGLSGVSYVMSKFGAAGLVQSINAEENKHGVRATSVFPGDINTPLLDKRPNPPAKELRVNMLQPDDVTDCVMLAVNLPDRVVVDEIVVRPFAEQHIITGHAVDEVVAGLPVKLVVPALVSCEAFEFGIRPTSGVIKERDHAHDDLLAVAVIVIET